MQYTLFLLCTPGIGNTDCDKKKNAEPINFSLIERKEPTSLFLLPAHER